jgi:hypothetical protein
MLRSSRRRRLETAFVLVAAGVLLAAPRGAAQRLVRTTDPKLPRVKYADSLTSLNDRCMVRKAKLNSRVRPVYVNSQPVGFC